MADRAADKRTLGNAVDSSTGCPLTARPGRCCVRWHIAAALWIGFEYYIGGAAKRRDLQQRLIGRSNNPLILVGQLLGDARNDARKSLGGVHRPHLLR